MDTNNAFHLLAMEAVTVETPEGETAEEIAPDNGDNMELQMVPEQSE